MYMEKMSKAFKIIVASVGVFVVTLCITIAANRTHSKWRKIIRKPHIIVMIADDMGWNDVSFHGSNQILTPNIDALAYNGVILKNHYVLPVCTPSRTAFFTGRYPIRDGMYGYPLRAGENRSIPLNVTLMPEHLHRLGYATHMVGKWHVGYSDDNKTPVRRGFQTFYGYYNGYITYFNHTITQDHQTGFDMHRDNQNELKPDMSNKNKYATDIFTDEAVKIIDKHDDDQPLYLQISHLAPHSSDGLETLETRDLAEVNETFAYIQEIHRRKYAGMVSALDESVGRVVAALSEKNLLENSIILFMSDNGAQTFGLLENYGSNYPLRGLKFTLYEGGVHGVACVYSPLIKHKARVVNDLFHITDWLPTFYSAAGGNVNELGEIDGINQWYNIKKDKKGQRKSLLVNINPEENLESAIIGQYKILKGSSELYDGYFGDNVNDNDPSGPGYNVEAVIASPTSQSIAETMGNATTYKQILQLREQSKIICKSFSKFSNCSVRCLFNLYNDPCETTDISDKHPEMVEKLEYYINEYRNVLVNQKGGYVDINSYPRNFDGFWMPWLNEFH
ncbi:hypothetical protein PV326_002412 [Microctonus aethiopoides]|nr:hypothetical protein PV326_002412 [Microctonus aethiopoides]